MASNLGTAAQAAKNLAPTGSVAGSSTATLGVGGGHTGATLAPGSPRPPRPITPLAEILTASLVKKSPTPVRSKQPSGVVHRPMPVRPAASPGSKTIGTGSSPRPAASLAAQKPPAPVKTTPPTGGTTTCSTSTAGNDDDVMRVSRPKSDEPSIPTQEIPAVADGEGSMDATDNRDQAVIPSRSPSRSPAVEELLGKVDDGELGDLLEFLEDIDTNPGVEILSQSKADVISKLEQSGALPGLPLEMKKPAGAAGGSAFTPVSRPAGTIPAPAVDGSVSSASPTDAPQPGTKFLSGKNAQGRSESAKSKGYVEKTGKLTPEPPHQVQAVITPRSRSRSPAVEEMLGKIDDSELGDLLDFLEDIEDCPPGTDDVTSNEKLATPMDKSGELTIPNSESGPGSTSDASVDIDDVIESLAAAEESIEPASNDTALSLLADLEIAADSTVSAPVDAGDTTEILSDDQNTHSEDIDQAATEAAPAIMSPNTNTEGASTDASTVTKSDLCESTVDDTTSTNVGKDGMSVGAVATDAAAGVTNEGMSTETACAPSDVSGCATTAATPSQVTADPSVEAAPEEPSSTVDDPHTALESSTSAETNQEPTSAPNTTTTLESETTANTSQEQTAPADATTVEGAAAATESAATTGSATATGSTAATEVQTGCPDPSNPAAIARGMLRRTSSVQVDARFEKAKAPPKEHPAYAEEGVLVYWSSLSSNRDMKWKTQRLFDILTGKKIAFTKVDITEHRCLLQRMRDLIGTRRSVPPQIFNGERYLGGFEEFEDAVEDGVLPSFLRLS